MLIENHVNRESKSRSSQFSYTNVMNMKILAVVTAPSIYHVLSSTISWTVLCDIAEIGTEWPMGTLVLSSWPINLTPRYHGKTLTYLLLVVDWISFQYFHPYYRHSLFSCATQCSWGCSSCAPQDCIFLLNGRRPLWGSGFFRFLCDEDSCNITHVSYGTLNYFPYSFPSLSINPTVASMRLAMELIDGE